MNPEQVLQHILDLNKNFAEFSGRLETKVDGINRRLDITNGRIAKNEDKTVDLEKKNIENQDLLRSVEKSISGVVTRNTQFDADSKLDKQYWKRFVVEKIGIAVATSLIWLLYIVLAKLGIVHI